MEGKVCCVVLYCPHWSDTILFPEEYLGVGEHCSHEPFENCKWMARIHQETPGPTWQRNQWWARDILEDKIKSSTHVRKKWQVRMYTSWALRSWKDTTDNTHQGPKAGLWGVRKLLFNDFHLGHLANGTVYWVTTDIRWPWCFHI